MKQKDLEIDTQNFLKSEYGVYVMGILEDQKRSYEAMAEDMSRENPIRYFDKATAIKEVIDMIQSPLQ